MPLIWRQVVGIQSGGSLNQKSQNSMDTIKWWQKKLEYVGKTKNKRESDETF
jgi:hypothetical protein